MNCEAPAPRDAAHHALDGRPGRRALERPSRLLFVADARSPIATNWISWFVAAGHEVHVVSTFPCDPLTGVASFHVIPVALGRFAGGATSTRTIATPRRAAVRRAAARARTALFPAAFGWVAPFDLAWHAHRLRALVQQIDPVLVHAMRVPYEGIMAARALEGTAYPLVLSTWGNDLELWAAQYPLVGLHTRRALGRATALHADCARDLRLARGWGWNADRPSVVLPGNGGVRSELFHAAPRDPAVLARYAVPTSAPLIVNARGFRSYVRNDTYFRAIPTVLAQREDAVFIGVSMAGHPDARRWARALGVEHALRLLPSLSPHEMAELFRASWASVSPSNYDGTPNTLLEAMACGSMPIAGDITSVREWVDDGRNGLLFDSASPRALAAALIRALDDEALRARAAAYNVALVAERASIERVMPQVESLYAAAVAATRDATA